MKDRIIEVIRRKQTKLNLLYLSSCNSESLAIEFKNLSVADHIICINKEEKVEDSKARAFAIIFFRELVKTQNYSICEAFFWAKLRLRKELEKIYGFIEASDKVDNIFKMILH